MNQGIYVKMEERMAKEDERIKELVRQEGDFWIGGIIGFSMYRVKVGTEFFTVSPKLLRCPAKDCKRI